MARKKRTASTFELPPPVDDGLVIPDVGEWSSAKHYYLRRYINAFTTSMRVKGWSGLHYIDLFAGAGIERLQTSKRLEWGSPLIAAQVRFPFTNLHLCEQDEERWNALQTRVQRLRSEAQICNGDGNQLAKAIVESIPEGSLSLAFLDPYGLDLQFTTVQVLSSRRADLIIFFPDFLDIFRNWGTVYQDEESKLDLFLGPRANWRQLRRSKPSQTWPDEILNHRARTRGAL